MSSTSAASTKPVQYNFNNLPTVIQLLIAPYLDPKEICQDSRVNRLFNVMMNNLSTWKMIAAKIDLKIVPNQNPKAAVIDYYNKINACAMSCLPEDTRKSFAAIKDPFALHSKIEKLLGKQDLNKEGLVRRTSIGYLFQTMLETINKERATKEGADTIKINAALLMIKEGLLFNFDNTSFGIFLNKARSSYVKNESQKFIHFPGDIKIYKAILNVFMKEQVPTWQSVASEKQIFLTLEEKLAILEENASYLLNSSTSFSSTSASDFIEALLEVGYVPDDGHIQTAIHEAPQSEWIKASERTPLTMLLKSLNAEQRQRAIAQMDHFLEEAYKELGDIDSLPDIFERTPEEIEMIKTGSKNELFRIIHWPEMVAQIRGTTQADTKEKASATSVNPSRERLLKILHEGEEHLLKSLSDLSPEKVQDATKMIQDLFADLKRYVEKEAPMPASATAQATTATAANPK